VKTQAVVKTDEKLTIEQIWNHFHEERNDHYRNLLMEHYRDLVRYAAERLHSKLPDKVEVDDLISAGIFGLMDAIDAYDPLRGVTPMPWKCTWAANRTSWSWPKSCR